MTTIFGWHFVGDTLRDGWPVPPDGETLRHEGPLKICPHSDEAARGIGGLHGSERAIDALKYASGNTACRVRLGGEMLRDTDKLVCRERTILWRVDATDLLREFERWCAHQLTHTWQPPDVVRQYLESGDDSLSDAASDATWDAAWATAMNARLEHVLFDAAGKGDAACPTSA